MPFPFEQASRQTSPSLKRQIAPTFMIDSLFTTLDTVMILTNIRGFLMKGIQNNRLLVEPAAIQRYASA